ncbi:uncharacterized protein LOC131943228 [Physella acuta]|uniref:uncharacterized protein LOC131943228 n=1 Tax=Physella acuta TaxID=109671 RepID=UPI0027DAD119|nr:uncharacterized protein LOC131943228 [Physella acuta]
MCSVSCNNILYWSACGRLHKNAMQKILLVKPNPTAIRQLYTTKISYSHGSVNNMEVQKLSDRLELHTALTRSTTQWPVDPKRVLVLFFPWLGARKKHIQKYCDLYRSTGLDVLVVNSANSDFLWPPNSFKLAKQTTEVLLTKLQRYDHYLLHSMSAGSYNLTVLGIHARDQGLKGQLLDKFRGVVYDSIVVGGGKAGVIKGAGSPDSGNEMPALDRMIKGVARSVSHNWAVEKLIMLVAKMYFFTTKKHTVEFYNKAVDVVRDEPFTVPTLVFASRDDPMCDAAVCQALVEIWRKEKKLPVTLRMWDSSPHAQHLNYHTQEYEAALHEFLSFVFSDKKFSISETKSKL